MHQVRNILTVCFILVTMDALSSFKNHSNALINHVESDARNRALLNRWKRTARPGERLILQRETSRKKLGMVIERRPGGNLKEVQARTVEVWYEKRRSGGFDSVMYVTTVLGTRLRSQRELQGDARRTVP